MAFNNYLAALGPRAPVKTVDEFIARGEFHSSLKAGLQNEQRWSTASTIPEYKNRLLRRQDLRQAVMAVMAANQAGRDSLSASAAPRRPDRRGTGGAQRRPLEQHRVPGDHVPRRLLPADGERPARRPGRHRIAGTRVERTHAHCAGLRVRAGCATAPPSCEHTTTGSLRGRRHEREGRGRQAPEIASPATVAVEHGDRTTAPRRCRRRTARRIRSILSESGHYPVGAHSDLQAGAQCTAKEKTRLRV